MARIQYKGNIYDTNDPQQNAELLRLQRAENIKKAQKALSPNRMINPQKRMEAANLLAQEGLLSPIQTSANSKLNNNSLLTGGNNNNMTPIPDGGFENMLLPVKDTLPDANKTYDAMKRKKYGK